MAKMKTLLAFLICIFATTSCTAQENPQGAVKTLKDPKYQCNMDTTQLTDEQLRATLTPEEYRVMREKGTERAFTGEYWNTKTPGVYKCRTCGEPLFSSQTKYDSGSGWPSFYAPIAPTVVAEHADHSHGMTRTEITCKKCGSHLGHVFDDGPNPTGLRYCVNSISLKLEPAK